jgi:hypothetical protein
MAFSYFVILSNDFSLYKYTKFMNSENIKFKIQKQADQFVSALESLLLQSDATKPNDFEFDLCKTKLMDLYNSICDLQQNGHQPVPSTPKPEDVEEYYVEPAIDTKEETAAETTESPQSEDVPPHSQESNEEFIDLPEAFEITDEVQISEPEQKVTNVHDHPESESHKEKSNTPKTLSDREQQPPKIISDKFQKESNSLHEKFNTEDKSISTRLKSNPILDLRKAIGINDRFTFINELFDGNKAKYDIFIDSICQAQSASEIKEILDTETMKSEWHEKPSFMILSDLINRYLQTK